MVYVPMFFGVRLFYMALWPDLEQSKTLEIRNSHLSIDTLKEGKKQIMCYQ